MREAIRLYSPFHAGADEVRIVVDVQSRHDGPLFAGFEFFEAGFEDAGRRPDQRADFCRHVPGGADAETFDGVAKRGAESWRRDRLRFRESTATWLSTSGRCG